MSLLHSPPSSMRSSPAVIVTTYNSSHCLARVLEGYRAQTLLPSEIVIADDGSSDETAGIVAAAAAVSPFPIHFTRQEHLGFRAARIRNAAARLVSADYIIFTDSDCIPHPSFVADHRLMAREDAFVQGRRILVSKNTASVFTHQSFRRLLRPCLYEHPAGWHYLLPIPGFCLNKKGIRGIRGCNFALHREDFLAVNGFNEDFEGWGREDSELAVRLFKYGLVRRDALFCAMVFHLWHPACPRDSLSRNDALLKAATESAGYRCRNGINGSGDEDQVRRAASTEPQLVS